MQTFSKNVYDYDARKPRLLKRRAIRILIPNIFLITRVHFNIFIRVLFPF
jgi:hypothetical protein